MPRFRPKFTITPRIAATLLRIESVREAVRHLPITPAVLASLRETARLYSTHYSTMIEGNRLTQEQVFRVVGKNQHFPGRERDEKEVLGYYLALERVEQFANDDRAITQDRIRLLHARSHNYYQGRARSDMTKWVDYFCQGMAGSFESVRERAQTEADAGASDASPLLRKLDPRQRRALELFRNIDAITSRDVEALFTLSQRAARNLLSAWSSGGFTVILDPAKRSRKYGLAPKFRKLVR